MNISRITSASRIQVQTPRLPIAETYRHRIDAWIIYDSQGRIATHALYRQDQSLNIASLASGAYTLMLMSEMKVIGVKVFAKG